MALPNRHRKYKKALLPRKALWKKKIPRKRKVDTYQRRFKRVAFTLLKTVFLLIFLGGVLYGLFYFLLRSGFFKVSEIVIAGTESFVNRLDLENVTKDRVLDENLFKVDIYALEESLLSQFQGAKDIKVIKQLPNRLKIQVFERVPLALVFNDSSSDYFLVDTQGYILGIVDNKQTNLPEIKYEGEIRVGEFIDEKLVPVYLEVTSALDGVNINVSSMSFYPKYVQIFAEPGYEILIGADKNKKGAFQVVVDLVKQLAGEGKKVRKVDLRYDKVIVSY